MTDDRRNRNAILFLGPDEIKGLITMEESVAAIAQGYREADEFRHCHLWTPPRLQVVFDA
jgi:hypothetical protein